MTKKAVYENKKIESRSGVLLRLVKGSKRFFIGGILFAWLTSVLDLINPKIISFTVDSVIGHAPADAGTGIQKLLELAGGTENLRGHILLIGVLVILIATAAAVCRYTFRVMNIKGQESMLRHTRNLLYSHIMSLPVAWHNENHTGDIIQRCTSDVDVIRAFLADQLTTLIRMVVSILLSLTFMLSISVKLTAIVSVFVPLMIGFSYYFHKRIEESFEKVDRMEGRLSAVAQENLTGIRVVRAFGREAYEQKRFTDCNEEYTGMWTHLMHLLSLFWATGDALAGLQTLLVLLAGAGLCLSENLTVGGYIAFLSYCGMLSGPVRMLGRVISGMSRAGVSIDRIRYILNAQAEDSPGDEKPELAGDIVFDHVRFHYGKEGNVLDDVSMTCKAGQVTGILGSTGCGKSTLMYLLCRLYDLEPGCGTITVGGKDISHMSRSWVRQNVGIVLQEPFLFSKTLGENIAITDEHADMDRIREVSQIAALDETIQKFSKRYDTFVGERGVTLSGGQKQRAAIAQTLMRNTPIMILDDSLSAVDSQTDAKIRKALNKMEHSTRILISHRITTLMHADRIIVMDKGRIVESGTHEELYEKHGLYYRICELQSPEQSLGA